METLLKPLSKQDLQTLCYWMIDNANDEVNEKWLVAYSEILRLQSVEDEVIKLRQVIDRQQNLLDHYGSLLNEIGADNA